MQIKYSSLLAVLLLLLTVTATARAQVTFQWAAVGNAGNANDAAGYGAVSYPYQIGKQEVTNGQYAAFLNAKAASDPLELYNPNMAFHGITRSGSSGGYTYAVSSGFADKPVVYVSWYDALRFANWVNNGQGSAADTEGGAYTLTGGTPVPGNNNSITRNAGAVVFLPSENEWHKAAYHQPAAAGGDGDNYWSYPTRSNTAPTAEPPPGGSNSANFGGSPTPYRVYDVGAYAASGSFYGTFDQAGNVWEWNEFRGGLRGGSYFDGSIDFHAFVRGQTEPAGEDNDWGIRLASVPEPSGLAVIAVGAIALLRRRVRGA